LDLSDIISPHISMLTSPLILVRDKQSNSLSYVLRNNYKEQNDTNLQRVLEDIVLYSGTCYSCEDCKTKLDCSTIFDKKNFEVRINDHQK
jgi:hypothetical protein